MGDQTPQHFLDKTSVQPPIQPRQIFPNDRPKEPVGSFLSAVQYFSRVGGLRRRVQIPLILRICAAIRAIATRESDLRSGIVFVFLQLGREPRGLGKPAMQELHQFLAASVINPVKQIPLTAAKLSQRLAFYVAPSPSEMGAEGRLP